MKDMISVKLNGSRLSVSVGTVLSEAVGSHKPCGGHGRCGKCKVVVRGEVSEPSEAELKLLTADELASGVRLSCLTRVLGDCEVQLPSEEERSQIVTDGELPELELMPSFEKYGVAIDIGTTTLAARLYDTKGNMLADASRLNPQQEWGADVISRIEASLAEKGEALATSVRKALSEMITELSEKAGILSSDIGQAVVTGNTVMLSLLTNECVEPFSHSPFAIKRFFGETLAAKELDLDALSPDTPVYLPPCISAFIGADTTCALMSTRLCASENAVMLADIGTNGEMAIYNKGSLTVCSTAAGPAFEGVGISMGMRGAVGAIDKVCVVNGALDAHVIGNVAPKGICGSGLVDAVACMLDIEELDESGYLDDDSIAVRNPVVLTQSDIRMLQLAKSAICAGLVTLIAHEELDASDVGTLYVAGGFGSYLNKDSAAKIGLLPTELARVSRAVGNAALAGAAMLLLNAEMRTEALKVAKSAAHVDLSTDPVFSENYMMGMLFERV